jgi:hypothetical protein
MLLHKLVFEWIMDYGVWSMYYTMASSEKKDASLFCM